AGHGNLQLTAAADGRFAFPSQEPPCAILAVHDSGIAIATAEELAAIARFQLQPWGRIEITTDTATASDEEIPYYLDYPDLPKGADNAPLIWFNPVARRTAENRIVFEKLPPGKARLGRYNQSNHEALSLTIIGAKTLTFDFDRGSVA